jgi:hypothetical protein
MTTPTGPTDDGPTEYFLAAQAQRRRNLLIAGAVAVVLLVSVPVYFAYQALWGGRGAERALSSFLEAGDVATAEKFVCRGSRGQMIVKAPDTKYEIVEVERSGDRAFVGVERKYAGQNNLGQREVTTEITYYIMIREDGQWRVCETESERPTLP